MDEYWFSKKYFGRKSLFGDKFFDISVNLFPFQFFIGFLWRTFDFYGKRGNNLWNVLLAVDNEFRGELNNYLTSKESA